ncbi:MAG: hypothetical protein GX847_10450, partial [Clostridiales bacterium]|nr:hypothetical protein [Clostridiales bacterium]
ALEGASVPSYFESFNQDLIDVLRQLDNAVYYLLTAIAIDDPVRYDSGEYFLEILVRRTDEISLNGVTDMEERLGKLREDILAVQNTCAGLTGWLDTNIANLDGK